MNIEKIKPFILREFSPEKAEKVLDAAVQVIAGDAGMALKLHAKSLVYYAKSPAFESLRRAYWKKAA